jgi:hypothetical protein
MATPFIGHDGRADQSAPPQPDQLTLPDQEHSPDGQAGPPMATEAACAGGSAASPAGDIRPLPRSRPSRRTLLTAGGVTAVGAMAFTTSRQAPAAAAVNYVVQGAQVISVNDAAYGAVGNGTADDTDAIQAALDATPPADGGVGVCLFPQPSAFYLISKTLVVPPGISVLGPAVGPPAKERTSSNPTPPVIKVADGANLDAIISDTAFTSTSTAPGPAGGILLNGLVLDGNSAEQTAGLGHGIALMGSGNAIVDCGTQNTFGSGIVLADQSAAGHNCTASSLEDNVINFCRVYQAGGYGIWVQRFVGISDGHMHDNIVDQDFTGAASAFSYTATQASPAVFTATNSTYINGQAVQLYGGTPPGGFANGTVYYVTIASGQSFSLATTPAGAAIDSTATGNGTVRAVNSAVRMDSSGGWRIVHNHVYALPGNGYDIPFASGTYIESNRVDNFGQAGVAGVTYYGYNIGANTPGCKFTGNQTNQTISGGGDGNWVHFNVSSGSAALPVYFSDNLVQQTAPTTISGTLTGYSFTGGAGGLSVMDVVGAFVTPAQVSAYPDVSGTVTFPGFSGTGTSYASIQNPASTTSDTPIMGGLNLSFTPAVTGKAQITFYGGIKAVTAATGTSAGLRYAATTFTAGSPAPSSPVAGKDQSVYAASTGYGTPFVITGVVTRLPLGVPTYFDLAYAGNGTDGAAPVNLYATIQEIS